MENTIKFEFSLDNVHVEYEFRRGKESYREKCIKIGELDFYTPYAVIKAGRSTRDLREKIAALDAGSPSFWSLSSVSETLHKSLSEFDAKSEIFAVNLLKLSDENLFKIMSIDPKEWKLAKKEAFENFPADHNINILKVDIMNFEDRFSPELKLLLELGSEEEA